MDNPIPRGPDKLYCPMWRKKMSTVCHTCPMWMHIRGKNPNTGQDIDRWSCAFTQLPVMMIENAQAVRSAAAEVNELRKEQHTRHEQTQYPQMTLLPTTVTPLLAHKEPSDENR